MNLSSVIMAYVGLDVSCNGFPILPSKKELVAFNIVIEFDYRSFMVESVNRIVG